ncbi:unnamed protein product [Lampetra fluviatilis]
MAPTRATQVWTVLSLSEPEPAVYVALRLQVVTEPGLGLQRGGSGLEEVAPVMVVVVVVKGSQAVCDSGLAMLLVRGVSFTRCSLNSTCLPGIVSG